MRSCEARSARLQASAIVNHAIETCSSLLPRLASLPCIDAIDADLAMRGKRALAEHPKARRIDPDFFPKLASQSILVGLLSLDMAPDHVPQSGADPRSRSCSTTALSRRRADAAAPAVGVGAFARLRLDRPSPGQGSPPARLPRSEREEGVDIIGLSGGS